MKAIREQPETNKIPSWLDIWISNEVLNDFFNRIWKDLAVEDKNEFFDKLKKQISENKLYNPILDRLQEYIKDWQVDFSRIKDEKIVNYEWPVITFGIDLKWSSKSIYTKDVYEKFFGLVNLFEKLYEDMNLAVFSQVEGDKIYVGFFNKKQKESIEIFKLFYYLLQGFTNQQYHLEWFTWEKKKWEVSMAVFKDVIIHTISSENLNKVMKEMKKYESNNHVISVELLKILGGDLDSRNSWIKYFGVDLLDSDKVFQTLKKLNEIDWKNDKFIFSVILTYIVNNNIEGWTPKVETIEKWRKIIGYGEENTDVYLILDGTVRLYLKGNPLLSKIVPAKTIIWEMSVKNRLADADVFAESELKVIRIPKEIFKKFSEKTLNKVLVERFQELMDRYISSRASENIKLDAVLQQIKEKIGDNNFEKVMRLLVDFQWDWTEVKNKIILEEKQENNKIYVIKAGSKIKITKNWRTKYVQLASDWIFWEISYINSKKLWKNSEATATVEIISWSYKETDFDSYGRYLSSNKFNLIKWLEKLLRKNQERVVDINDLMDVLLILYNARLETSIFINFSVSSSKRKVA